MSEFGTNDKSHYMNPLEVNELINKAYQRGQKEGYDRGYFQGKQDCQPELERLRKRVKELEYKIELCLKENIPEKIEDFYDIEE